MAKNKSERKPVIKRISEALDLPADLLFSLPRIMLTGDEEIYIENYRGIVCYSENEIKLNTTKMPLRITGEKMYIAQIAAEEITVCGRIKTVEFLR